MRGLPRHPARAARVRIRHGRCRARRPGRSARPVYALRSGVKPASSRLCISLTHAASHLVAPDGTESADCFYDNGFGDRTNRRLAGGLHFALPDEVYGPSGGPPEPERKRAWTSGVEEPEPDWAPWTTGATASGGRKTIGKSSAFYREYDAAADVGFALMRHNSLANPLALYVWLEDATPGAPPAPPPADLPPPPVDPEPLEEPPKRAEYTRGKRGRRAFHSERTAWYERATGATLEGTLEEQNAQFDKVARRYRAYSDYRAHRCVARFEHECDHGPVGMGPLPERLSSGSVTR